MRGKIGVKEGVRVVVKMTSTVAVYEIGGDVAILTDPGEKLTFARIGSGKEIVPEQEPM